MAAKFSWLSVGLAITRSLVSGFDSRSGNALVLLSFCSMNVLPSILEAHQMLPALMGQPVFAAYFHDLMNPTFANLSSFAIISHSSISFHLLFDLVFFLPHQLGLYWASFFIHFFPHASTISTIVLLETFSVSTPVISRIFSLVCPRKDLLRSSRQPSVLDQLDIGLPTAITIQKACCVDVLR